jgi:hypothetical protein
MYLSFVVSLDIMKNPEAATRAIMTPPSEARYLPFQVIIGFLKLCPFVI